MIRNPERFKKMTGKEMMELFISFLPVVQFTGGRFHAAAGTENTISWVQFESVITRIAREGNAWVMPDGDDKSEVSWPRFVEFIKSENPISNSMRRHHFVFLLPVTRSCAIC